MGNSTSNRRVTVVNDDVVGVVQVSEGVVRRLKGMSDRPTNYEKRNPVQEPQPADPESPPQPPPSYIPFAPPEPFSTTLEQRQKYHEEFKKAEKSWNSRIHELETQNRQLFETAKEKFSVTLQDVEENHMKNSYAPVCPDKQHQVLRCYRENAKLPLNCSREVHDFMNCVDKVRMTALSK